MTGKGIARCFENILEDWKTRETQSSACFNCPLSKQTNGPVLGVGNRRNPRIMVVGESPNEEPQTEDKSVDDVKGFLDRYWEEAQSSSSRGWKKMARVLHQIFRDLPNGRESIYLTNVWKCANNSLEDSSEERTVSLEKCTKHLVREIKCVNPKLMVVFGEKALNGLHYSLGEMNPAIGALLDEEVGRRQSYSEVEGKPIPIPQLKTTMLPAYHWSRGESFSSTQRRGGYQNRVMKVIASLLDDG